MKFPEKRTTIAVAGLKTSSAALAFMLAMILAVARAPAGAGWL